MVKLGNKDCIPFRGYYKPVAIYQGRKPVFEPITTPLTGEGIIAVEHTYDDKIDLLKIYGETSGGTLSVGGIVYHMLIQEVSKTQKGMVVSIDAEQKITITTNDTSPYTTSTNANLTADVGIVFQNYGPHWSVITSSDQCWPFEPGTYYVNIFNHTGENLGTGTPGLKVWRYIEGLSSGYHTLIASTSLNGNLTLQFDVEEFGYYGMSIAFSNPSTFDYDDDGVSFQLSVTDTPSTLPYHAPTTIEIPTLYTQDVMWVDRKQKRAWIEREGGSTEELDYTPLPTFPKYTTLVYEENNDVTPTMEVTLKRFKE